MVVSDCCELQVVGGWDNGIDIETWQMILSFNFKDVVK